MKHIQETDSAKTILISCILRQLKMMKMDGLREVYSAVCKITDQDKVRKQNLSESCSNRKY